MSLTSAALKQTVALQYPDRYIASAPDPSRSRASDRPVPRTLCHVDQKQGLHVQWYVRVRQVSGGEIRTCTPDSPPGPMSRRQAPFKQTPGADMERQGERAPEAARVARLQPRHRHDGKAEACHVCQARHANVHASSHVLIGERGRTRANTRRRLLLRRREPERAQTLARASLASI